MTAIDLGTIDPEIRTLVDDYFDLMHEQDMALFDRVFHPDSVLYGVVDGQINIRPYAVYREAVAARQSPATLGNKRRDVVLSVDKISGTLALLKMQLEMFGGVMQDYLNIVYLDGQWWVMAKMWEKVGEVTD
ncbi:MAG: nuclear transport factor 2 family protein [Pontimonas sp.]|nr:nuclear transport factor 2 family protein [Pontimonas sp.]